LLIFDGERVDVVSEGGYIEADTTVVAVKVEGRRVIVKLKRRSKKMDIYSIAIIVLVIYFYLSFSILFH